MANLLSGLDRPSKSKNTIRAENIQVGSGSGSGLLAGLKSYYGRKGAEEDEKAYQNFYDKRIELQQESDTKDAQGNVKGQFLNAVRIASDPEFKNNYSPEIQQNLLDYIKTNAKGVETLQGQAEAKSFGKGQGAIRIEPQLEFAKAQQKGLGKADAEDIVDLRSQSSKLPELEGVIERLGELGQKATYTLGGRGKDFLTRELGLEPSEGAVARAEYQATVNNQVLPLLRDTFGAAFTVQEGESLKATLGDINKSPQEKDAILRAFIAQKRRNIQSQTRKIGGQRQEVTFDDLWGE